MNFKCRTNCDGLRAAGKVACTHCLRHVPRHLISQLAVSKTPEARASSTRRIYEYLDKFPPPRMAQPPQSQQG